MALKKLRQAETPSDRQKRFIVNHIKSTEPKWDQYGAFAERCGELAKQVGVDAGVLYEEHCERSAVRFYDGGLTVEQAEEGAWQDVLSRFFV